MNEIIIDGTNALLGRLASFAAKRALQGKSVVVVNCDKVVVSGDRRMLIEQYQRHRKMGGSALNGPFFPSKPERIVKRTIRGMLPYKQGRGEAAFDKVRCYDDVPAKYVESKKIQAGKEKKIKTLSLKELEKEI